MLSKNELKDNLQEVEEIILTGQPKSYSDYKYYIGKRYIIVKMLVPKKRTPKQEEPNEKLQKFGFENPVQRKK